MTINRVTQSMLSTRALQGVHLSLSRLATTQEQLTTGRILNRPSDSPTDATAAMRLRSSLADAQQYARNAQDGRGWLAQIDGALQSMQDESRRAHGLLIQGANSGNMTVASREALAIEIEQIRGSLISTANTQYLERPVFGGVTAGDRAYDAAGNYLGTTAGEVTRTIAEGVTLRVDMDAQQAFGAPGATLFDDLEAAVNALRAGDEAGISAAITKVSEGMQRLVGAAAEIGGRTNRLESALQRASDSELTLKNSLSELENVDLAKAAVDLQLQEVAYQAALSATARIIQPTLLDFLR